MSLPAEALLRQAVADQQIRGATIRALLLALDEQRVRLDAQLTEALDALDLTAAPDVHSVPGAALVRVSCLGSFQVEIGGTAIQSWRSTKARALFQYLVLHRDRPTRREVLIETLWPDPDAMAASSSLKVTVHTLRQLLHPPQATAEIEILAQDSGYQLQATGLWVDVDEFERYCGRGRALERAGRIKEALDEYRRAADLYRGDLLADSWDDWAVFRREGLKDEYLLLLARLADAALAAGDYHECIRRSRQLLAQDRCREDTFRTLILCHARLGQPGRVRRWFELCVSTLRADLDAEPEPETIRLYEDALGGADARPRVSGAINQ